ncbi:MAG: ECF-type sigma factor [Planctomycetota bacterium]
MTAPNTRLLQLLEDTDRVSAAELLPVVYDELRSLARARMAREQPGHTLQATALVHEAYLRLGRPSEARWDGRRHFFAAAAESMRRILVDRARRRSQEKHGGAFDRQPFDEEQIPLEEPDVDVLAIDAALKQLEARDPRAREIVNLRCFVGLTIQETANAMELSTATVEREWRFLRTFLQHAMRLEME